MGESAAGFYEHLNQRVGIHCHITDRRGVVLFDFNRGLHKSENHYKYNDVWRTHQGSYGARSRRLIKC